MNLSVWARRHRTGPVVLAGALTAAVILLPAAPAAAADPVGCGSVLTTDTTLAADLTCTGDALVIGASGITVDLGGHTLTGDGSTGTGVRLGRSSTHATYDSVTIRNGTIRNFRIGVWLDSTSKDTITGVNFSGPEGTRAVWTSYASDSTFTRGRLDTATIQLGNSPGFTISDSQFTGSAVSATESNQVQITGNTVVDGRIAVVEDNYPVVANNRLVRSQIYVQICDWLTVRDNWITGADTGIFLDMVRRTSTVSGNVVVDSGIGVRMSIVPGLTVSGNSFIGNGTAGATLTVLPPDCATVTGTCVTIRNNVFIGNGYRPKDPVPNAGGLTVTAPAGSQVLVAGDWLVGNARYAIYAEPGTIVDGGGNHAIGGGCVGVACG